MFLGEYLIFFIYYLFSKIVGKTVCETELQGNDQHIYHAWALLHFKQQQKLDCGVDELLQGRNRSQAAVEQGSASSVITLPSSNHLSSTYSVGPACPVFEVMCEQNT